ncbi:cupin domain-containing protein [Halobacteria archaeon AArc-curdl1]|uniref:Cupin domain-containing protein n=1 Tax=Natronosalvus hydrolyticus TaxID=2979988 RepID=A0AAP2ZBT6_9EURY|nr:cupin domain-containing protein [Halobacteria archaeon AArc-curdl1]
MKQRTIGNGATGEQIIFGEYGTDENGRFLRLDEISLPADSTGPEEHRHLTGDEYFEAVEGRLGVRIGNEEFVLRPGESATAPAGVPHTWWNAGDTTVVWRGELRNPGRFEEMLTSYFALENRAMIDGNGRPSLVRSAVVVAEHAKEHDPSFLPWPVKFFLTSVLAPLGRALGYPAAVPYVPPPTPDAAEPTVTS